MTIITLKVYNSGEIRRIPFDAPASGPIYSNLVQKIRSSITDLDLATATINWKDDEGDFIVLRTDEEATEAIKNVKDSVLKLYIIEKDGPRPPPSTASSVIIEDQIGEALMDDDYAIDEDQPHEEQVDDSEEPNGDRQIHRGVVCDGCEGQIAGRRFKCCVCYDFDLCKDCEQKGIETSDHKSTHPMILLSSPRALRQHPRLRFMMQRMSGHIPRGPAPGCPYWRNRGPPPPFGPWNFGPDSQMFGGRWGRRSGPRGGHGHQWGMHQGRPGCKRGPGHRRGGTGSGCPEWIRDMRNAMDSLNDPSAEGTDTTTQQAKGNAADAPTSGRPDTAAEFLRCVGVGVANALQAFGIDVDVHTAGECSENCPGHTEGEKTTTGAAAKETESAEPMNEEETSEETVEKSTTSTETPVKVFTDPTMPKDKVVAEGNKEKSATGWVLLHPAKAVDVEGAGQQPLVYPQIPQQTPTAPTGATGSDQAAAVNHPDPRVAAALRHMLNMGFTNDGGWLTQLLEAKNGDISAVLDVLAPASRRS